MIQKLIAITILTIVPLSVAYGQESWLDFDETFTSEQFEELEEFEQIEQTEQIEELNTELQTSNSAANESEATQDLSDTDDGEIYSTDSNEIVLYRSGEEVKRLPNNVPIISHRAAENDNDDTKPQPEPVFAEPTDNVLISSDLLVDNGSGSDTVASGTGSDAGTGSTVNDEELKSAATTRGSLFGGKLIMIISIIAIAAGGFIGLKMLKPKRAALADMPASPQFDGTTKSIEEKLAALKDEE